MEEDPDWKDYLSFYIPVRYTPLRNQLYDVYYGLWPNKSYKRVHLICWKWGFIGPKIQTDTGHIVYHQALAYY
jgi:hypothetical protein